MCCIWSNEHILNDPELTTSWWYGTRPNHGPAQAARAEGSPYCTHVHQSHSLSLPTALPELILANAGIWAMTSEAAHQQLIVGQSFFFFLNYPIFFLSHVLHLRQVQDMIYCCFDIHWHMASEMQHKWFRLLQQLIYSLYTQPELPVMPRLGKSDALHPARGSSSHLSITG